MCQNHNRIRTGTQRLHKNKTPTVEQQQAEGKIQKHKTVEAQQAQQQPKC